MATGWLMRGVPFVALGQRSHPGLLLKTGPSLRPTSSHNGLLQVSPARFVCGLLLCSAQVRTGGSNLNFIVNLAHLPALQPALHPFDIFHALKTLHAIVDTLRAAGGQFAGVNTLVGGTAAVLVILASASFQVPRLAVQHAHVSHIDMKLGPCLPFATGSTRSTQSGRAQLVMQCSTL